MSRTECARCGGELVQHIGPGIDARYVNVCDECVERVAPEWKD